MTQTTDFTPSLVIHDEVKSLESFSEEYEQASIVLFENITKNELFLFTSIFVDINLISNDLVTAAIAVPNCSNLDLHELILENCYQNYDYKEIPKKLSSARRETWRVLKEVTEYYGKTPLIAIACSENLTTKAIEEIYDLQIRCNVTFLLSTVDNRKNVPIKREFPSSYYRFSLPQLLQISKTIYACTEQGISASQAFAMIQQSLVDYSSDGEDNTEEDE